MGFFIGDNMSKNVQTGDVIFSEDVKPFFMDGLTQKKRLKLLRISLMKL